MSATMPHGLLEVGNLAAVTPLPALQWAVGINKLVIDRVILTQ